MVRVCVCALARPVLDLRSAPQLPKHVHRLPRCLLSPTPPPPPPQAAPEELWAQGGAPENMFVFQNHACTPPSVSANADLSLSGNGSGRGFNAFEPTHDNDANGAGGAADGAASI